MRYAFLLMTPLLAAAADLNAVKAEANLEKRSELALDHAGQTIDAARTAFQAGDGAKLEAALGEIGDSVDLSYSSLERTGKAPRNNKYFKRAELRTRALLRRLQEFGHEVGIDLRPSVERIESRVQDVHDRLLASIMSKTKK